MKFAPKSIKKRPTTNDQRLTINDLSAFYIHIPFCKQACIYCNFHFSTVLKNKAEMLIALENEIYLRKDYLEDEAIETIYFGGGTPSILDTSEIRNLLNAVYRNYKIEPGDIEITLEANPDDLSFEKLKELKDAGINRLSIGIQSFFDEELKWLNRAHNAGQSISCIENAHKAGFENITIDLIYGIPGQTDEMWMKNLQMVKDLDIPHFSAYALTVEPKTALDHMISSGKITGVEEEQSASHFILMQDWVAKNGYEAYEISNYCKPGRYSKHNSSYWQGKKYIGIGPSAHSFNGKSRQWNIANNSLYIKNINENEFFYEVEELTAEQQYNEYIMTGLRTIWGCSRDVIKDRFGSSFLLHFDKNARSYFSDGYLTEKDNIVSLTLAGKLLADKISSDLFMV